MGTSGSLQVIQFPYPGTFKNSVPTYFCLRDNWENLRSYLHHIHFPCCTKRLREIRHWHLACDVLSFAFKTSEIPFFPNGPLNAAWYGFSNFLPAFSCSFPCPAEEKRFWHCPCDTKNAEKQTVKEVVICIFFCLLRHVALVAKIHASLLEVMLYQNSLVCKCPAETCLLCGVL